MSLMKKVARHHGFRVLLHEKPFAGINGSGIPKISLNPGYNPFKSSSSTGAVPMGASFSVPKSKPHMAKITACLIPELMFIISPPLLSC